MALEAVSHELAFAVSSAQSPFFRQGCSGNVESGAIPATVLLTCAGNLAIAICLRVIGFTLVPSGFLFLLALRAGAVETGCCIPVAGGGKYGSMEIESRNAWMQTRMIGFTGVGGLSR